MLSHTTSIGAAMCILDHGFAGTGIDCERGANFIMGENAIYDGWIERPEIVLTFSWLGHLPLKGESTARDRANCLYLYHKNDVYIDRCDNHMLRFEKFMIIEDSWQEFPIRRRDRWLKRNKEKLCSNYFSNRIGTQVGVRHR